MKSSGFKEKNKNIIQSRIMTVSRYNTNLFEKRIFYKIVETFQYKFEGRKLNYITSLSIFENKELKEISFPLSELIMTNNKVEYAKIKTAFDNLMFKKITYEDENKYVSQPLFASVEITKRKNKTVYVTMKKNIYNAFLNFSKGHTKFQLKAILSLKHKFSMRFYEFISMQKKPLTYRIKEIKLMLGIENKYNIITSFEKKVLIPSIEELNKKAPYSFDYTLIKEGNKYTKIVFIPKYIKSNDDMKLKMQDLYNHTSIRWYLHPEIEKYIIKEFGITKEGIKRNGALFESIANKIGDNNLSYLIHEIQTQMYRLDLKYEVLNKVGYLINELKKFDCQNEKAIKL